MSKIEADPPPASEMWIRQSSGVLRHAVVEESQGAGTRMPQASTSVAGLVPRVFLEATPLPSLLEDQLPTPLGNDLALKLRMLLGKPNLVSCLPCTCSCLQHGLKEEILEKFRDRWQTKHSSIDAWQLASTIQAGRALHQTHEVRAKRGSYFDLVSWNATSR